MTVIQHKPYIPSSKTIAELTPKAVILGIFFGLLFGVTTTYLALKVGLTVSASIPIAVLTISLFKRFQSTILENNIVQTIGSAGESIAAGVAFTLPALLFLSDGEHYFHAFQIFTLALCGGIIGVLFMVPLRRSLIVEEHGKLPFPEGTACADILIAGEKGGSLASKVFWGIGIAVVYKLFMSVFGFFKEIVAYAFAKKSVLPNAVATAELSPELLGVGYIIGPRISAIMVSGGILSSFVLIPLISYFGAHLSAPLAPATKLITDMSPSEIWSNYIRFIGAGAVTFAGFTTLLKTMPSICSTVKQSYVKLRGKSTEYSNEHRVNQDLPMWFVVAGSAVIIASMMFLPNLPMNFLSAILVVVAGFFFVTVACRIVGMVGTSSNPVSGMTIATLMGTCLIFLSLGLSADSYQPVALIVGAIVAIAIANAGATSQDLKTGFIIGATPYKQQIGIMLGAIASAVAIGFTITFLNTYIGIGNVTAEHPNPLPAPQAMLMATIVKGLFTQNLPWTLVLIGMAAALFGELLGVSGLAFAIGLYLPLSTTMPIFIGGVISWIVHRRKKGLVEDSEMESGVLFSSGLIAGGALMGIVVAILIGTTTRLADGTKASLLSLVNFELLEKLGGLGDLISLAFFGGLCYAIYHFALKKDEHHA